MVNDISLNYDFTGNKYGEFTPEGNHATGLFKSFGIQLDGTYTAKAAAALLHDLQSGVLDNKVILFWYTFCDNAEQTVNEHKLLPRAFHQYFVPSPRN